MGKRIRAVAIVIKGDSILLMHRINKNTEYWSFIGGGVEPGESTEQAVIRELYEEASVSASINRLLYVYNNKEPVQSRYSSEHHFYICDYISGTPKLGIGPEKMTTDNVYDPQWVPLETFRTIKIHPQEAQKAVLDSCLNPKRPH